MTTSTRPRFLDFLPRRPGGVAVLLLLLWTLVLAPRVLAADAGHTVVLRAHITIGNTGDVAVAPYVFRLSMPADNHAQQRMLGIEYGQGDGYRVDGHANGVDKYMTFNWALPPRSRLEREVAFVLRVAPYDYRRAPLPGPRGPDATFRKPSLYVESEAAEVVAIARDIKRRHATPEARLRAAFRYPQERLRYQTMPNRGALHALRTGVGDCTEYAAIFVAIARAMGYPARLTSEFLFSQRNSFTLPNHHAAEVWLNGQWLPVDPNLALEPALGYGFGQGAASKVVLKRDGAWTWAQQTPGLPASYRRKHVDVDIKWTVEERR